MTKKVIILISIIIISVFLTKNIESFLIYYNMLYYTQYLNAYNKWNNALIRNLQRNDGRPVLDPFYGLPLMDI